MHLPSLSHVTEIFEDKTCKFLRYLLFMCHWKQTTATFSYCIVYKDSYSHFVIMTFRTRQLYKAIEETQVHFCMGGLNAFFLHLDVVGIEFVIRSGQLSRYGQIGYELGEQRNWFRFQRCSLQVGYLRGRQTHPGSCPVGSQNF